jgi:hypothetical protein
MEPCDLINRAASAESVAINQIATRLSLRLFFKDHKPVA